MARVGVQSADTERSKLPRSFVAMHARLRAMMDRIGPAAKTIAAGVGVGGTFKLAVDGHDIWQARIKRQQEAEDRNRIMNRVIHSAFHAAKPEVEIPRKHVQARHRKCSAAVCFVLNAPCARPRSAGCWTCMIAPPC